ncbi:uncharacterized protein NECHADRAFT_85003 [Fusarium vanettenii 77-13-4]|uniref:Uncharacterized protein n=1 Tax=Fusarium vanettenii (strain ATCC MYA-4622 / CBS 123669 / FGSC 9596 / NRRL 45880 / 77-13-4) TaxID=660122 RepID=C7YUQ5_FUSV7|nr:uncharacterized protein NECHADRAFT_85003 [Fusarium vanettenii 77-13-4]EEU44846.1 predicted protein [Fusarium vanettenii 77-13-4]
MHPSFRETWEISELLANPKTIKVNPKVINIATYPLEFGLNRRTRQQLLDLAYDAIDGVQIILEQYRRLASVSSGIKGQGAEWECQLEHRRQLGLILKIERELEERRLFAALFPHSHFDDEWVSRFMELTRRRVDEIGSGLMDIVKYINASGKLPAVLNDEASTDQRMAQLQGPRHAGMPSLMDSYHTMKDDEIKCEALGAVEALETLFCKAKAEMVRSLVYLGNKEMEEGPKKVLHAIIGDLFDYDQDMRLLRRYVDRLQHLKPRTADRVLRQRVITEFEACKFDQATARFANRLKYQLSSLERIADHVSSCDARPRDSPKPSQEDIQEQNLFQTMGQGFAEAVYEDPGFRINREAWRDSDMF